MGLTFFERAAHGFGVALAVLIIPVVIAIQMVPSIWPPNGLTQAQYAFCNLDYRAASAGLFGSPDFVADVAYSFVRPLPDYIAPWGFRDPQWAAACRYSYVLDGVSGEQSVWCAADSNRPLVAQAVETLGKEGDGPESYSPPGDSATEYVQACRVAYDYLRAAPAVPITPDIPAFALTASETRYCGDLGAHAVDSILAKVGLAPALHPTPVEAAESRAVGCRLAFIEATWDRGGY